ncbi:hypothetical protein QCA50_013695 [Cerrena zonata]|uniref:Uncharacterized protein n=1 Tax=Cerrena zonata TaxID=2478898 RepID=A0AAW0FPQ1_9APHY
MRTILILIHTHANILFSLAHHPGAIAGVVIGSVAFAGLLVAWLFIARRRHQMAVREAESAVLTSANSGGGGDAFGSGRARALFLDDDSRSMLHNTQPRMSQMYTGASIVRGSVEYGRLHSGLPEPQEIISPDNPPGLGGATTAVNPQGDSPGTREDDAFMKNNSRMDVNEVEITPAQKSPMSYLSRASSGLSAPGPDPAAWLGNKDIIFTPVKTISPQPSTPGFGHSSSEGHVTSAIGSGSSDMVHLMPSQNDTVHSAGSLSGHGGGDIMSMSALPYAGGSGSSEHDQSPTGGSSSGHGGGSSSQGHAASSGGSHGHRPSEGRKSPGPSSLLPTQTQTQHPPIAFRNVEDEKKSRRRSFLGRPLKWRIRGGRPSSSSSMSSISNYSQPSPAPTLSFSDRRPLSAEMSMQSPPATHSVSRSSSIRRSHTPTLSSLPPPLLHVHTMFQPHEVDIPEDQVPPEAPHWPVFGNPAMPSPAWTDRSSQNLPDGLLDPRLGVRLGTGGASGSSAAISLRDDQDYSRPIGGFVNNRMYSTTTIPTVDTQGSHYTTSRRNSDESHQTRRFEADTDTPQDEFIAI